MPAAFMIRWQTCEEVGPLDEEFAVYYNDMDWCYRTEAAGREIWYLPDPVVIHYLGKTEGAVNREFAFLFLAGQRSWCTVFC